MIDQQRPRRGRQAVDSPGHCSSQDGSEAGLARSVGISVAFGEGSSLALVLVLDPGGSLARCRKWHCSPVQEPARLADSENVELSYSIRDQMRGKPFWNRSATHQPRWRIQFVAVVFMSVLLWREQGIAVALVTSALVPPLMAVIYLRMMKLEVIADAAGVRATNWFRTRRWHWEDIASFEFVRTRFIGLYKARVILKSGQTCVLSSLVGSTSGDLERDEKPRAFVEQLCAEVHRHQ